MYCPTCGLEHQEARRFCNRCGTNLGAISRTLNGDFPDPTAAEKLEKRRKAISRGFLVFCSGPIFGFSMLILSEVLRALLRNPNSLVVFRYPPAVYVIENLGFFGFLLSFIGIVMVINAVIVYGRKKHLLRDALEPPPPLLNAPLRSESSTSNPTAVTSPAVPPSVTENTTVHLDSEGQFSPRADTPPTEEAAAAAEPDRRAERGQ